MLSQAQTPSPLTLLVIFTGVMIVAAAVALAVTRVIRRRAVGPRTRRDAQNAPPDAWEEAGRRLQIPPDDL